MNLLPVSLSIVLFWTQPLAAIVISWLFGGGTITVFEMVSVAAAMFGVVLLSFPTLVSGGSVSD